MATNLSTSTNPNGQNSGNGITGTTGGSWVDLTADLSAFAGQTVTIGFRYWTDGAAIEPGFMADSVTVNDVVIGDAETDAPWTFDGFKTTTGTETNHYFNAYVVENRNYVEYDNGLKTGPYNFGFLNTLPDTGRALPLPGRDPDQLLGFARTRTTTRRQHPGGGLILPIDAHPNALARPDATKWRARVQAYDSTFGLQPTDAVTLHVNGVASAIPSLPGVSVVRRH